MTKGLLKSLWGPGGVRLLAGDVLLMLVLVVLSGTLLSFSGREMSSPGYIDVEISGRQGFRLPVESDVIRETAGPLGMTRIEVRDGRVRILSSPCPLKLCQKAGWIGSAGEMIVCLPNEVVVRVPGNLPGGVDALSR